MIDLLDHLLNWPEYTKLLIGLLAIVDPIGGMPSVIALISNRSLSDRQRIVLIAVSFATVVMILFTFFGESILEMFGISLPAFQIAGGVLIFLSALQMLRSTPTTDEAVASEAGSNAVAFVPIGIPLLAGPGALSTIVIFSHFDQEPGHKVLMVGVIITVGIIVLALLSLAPLVQRVLGKTGMTVVNRVMGLLLLSIAIEFIADGIADHFMIPIIH